MVSADPRMYGAGMTNPASKTLHPIASNGRAPAHASAVVAAAQIGLPAPRLSVLTLALAASKPPDGRGR